MDCRDLWASTFVDAIKVLKPDGRSQAAFRLEDGEWSSDKDTTNHT